VSTIPVLLVTNFSDLTINDFIVKTRFIADKMEVHPAFLEDNLPEYLAKAPRLREIAEALGQARDAAAGGDHGKIAEKKALRELGQQALTMIAQHITMLSLHRKDPSLLNNCGFELKQQKSSAKATVSLLDLAPGLDAKHGPFSGYIALLLKRFKQSLVVEVQSTDQDPANEASWGNSGMHNRSRIEMKGLTPASRIHFRARYHDDGRTGPWSSIVSIIVL